LRAHEPTWSTDGKQIAYGERKDNVEKLQSMRLHMIDLARHTNEELPDSLGLWTARWSPDGRWIAALTIDSKAVVMLDVAKKTRSEIARFTFMENPVWSPDSLWLYGETRDDVNGRAIYRVRFDGSVKERAADLRGFPTPSEHWFGVAPNGGIIGTRSVKVSDIYALECNFP
jgi:Tol biopolymer transport system component